MIRDENVLRMPYREVRAVREREDGPWGGVLVRLDSGGVGVLVDAEQLGPEWLGWSVAPAGHVLTPIDVVRSGRGHDVLLPVCAERLDAFVHRRSARSALSPGEAVTLGVSILRGCAQIAAYPDTAGEWWLDDSGRPVLATGASPQRAVEAAIAALDDAEIDPRMRGAWDAAIEAISSTRVSLRDIADAEERLFAVAAPEPLSTTSLRPRTAGDVARAHGAPTHVAPNPAERPLWQTLLASVDSDLADAVSRATTAVWRRLRRPTPSRRAPWVVGGVVAAVVLAGGALWPTAGGAVSGGAEAPEPAAAPTDVATSEATTATPTPSVASSHEAPDLAVVAALLLDSRIECDGDVDCLVTVVADPAMQFPPGVTDRPAGERALTLLDDFGDLAVLRVDASDGSSPAQLMVIVRQDEKWLLRDVHDVAQQP